MLRTSAGVLQCSNLTLGNIMSYILAFSNSSLFGHQPVFAAPHPTPNRPPRCGELPGISTVASNFCLATSASLILSPCTGRRRFVLRVAGNWPSCPRLRPIPHFRSYTNGRQGHQVIRLRLTARKTNPAWLTTLFLRPTNKTRITRDRENGIAVPRRRLALGHTITTHKVEQIGGTTRICRIAWMCFRKS